jgi:hypothetical protein
MSVLIYISYQKSQLWTVLKKPRQTAFITNEYLTAEYIMNIAHLIN